jgi:hypothetical protein
LSKCPIFSFFWQPWIFKNSNIGSKSLS